MIVTPVTPTIGAVVDGIDLAAPVPAAQQEALREALRRHLVLFLRDQHLTDEQHVALVQRAMIDIHGEVAQEQWTGAYDRICWENNEFQAGAWASPTVGQQELYLPAYFHTEKHTVFGTY